MGRRIRFIPDGGSLVEVTCRTIQGRYLMRPSAECRDLILGILARAASRYQPGIHAFAFLSNHYHLLLSVRDAYQLARFMQYLNSDLAREIGRLVRWRDSFWSRRYQAILVSDEEAAQVSRFRYILAQAAKEGLVASPRDWPCAHCVQPLLGDGSFRGHWFDRTREFAARQRGESFGRMDFATLETGHLDPLPCWSGMASSERRRYVCEFVAEVEQECSGADSGAGTFEAHRIDPHDKPRRFKPSPAPLAHCASKRVRRELWHAYHWFLAAYRDASEKFRDGDFSVPFPDGCFPPSPAFLAPVPL